MQEEKTPHTNNMEPEKNASSSENQPNTAETSLEAQLADLEKQLAEMKDNWLRALAESENLRRRAQKDREDALKYGAVNFARDMVVIADNLQRALQSFPGADDLAPNAKALIEGVEMTARELLSTFERHNIKRISPQGERFDPNFHQAMFEVEAADQPAGTVLQVLQDGYVMHERLLRPAMVGVSKSPAPELPNSSELKINTIA